MYVPEESFIALPLDSVIPSNTFMERSLSYSGFAFRCFYYLESCSSYPLCLRLVPSLHEPMLTVE